MVGYACPRPSDFAGPRPRAGRTGHAVLDKGRWSRETEGMTRDDTYSRVDYRRFVAWPDRIRREAPFLLEVFSAAPSRRLVDLGCGTGEHCRFFAERGFEVVGIDSSESMIEEARRTPGAEKVSFLIGDIRNVGELLEADVGAAVCLGNTLTHLAAPADLAAAFEGLARRLRPDGIFLFQILNYPRLVRDNIRHLPLNFKMDGPREEIFFRLMEFLPGGRVRFCPTTLLYDPGEECPLRVVRSRRVELKGWTIEELEPLLDGAGFEVRAVFGDMEGSAFDPAVSGDLVVEARRRG
jgi:glycine/sarcosine N-methyltransferase